MSKEKLEFKNSENQAYVYFIRPKPHKNYDNMPVFLSVAYSEDDAWSYVLKTKSIKKSDYYIDDIFLSHTGQALGLMWGNDPSI
jgi:hypothetical protein